MDPSPGGVDASGAVYRPFGALRLVLAMIVAIYHAPVGLLPTWASMAGPVAVFVFFALSGFIITEAAAVFYSGRPLAFLGNRFARLYPPYLIALALWIIVSAPLATHAGLPDSAYDPPNLLLNVLALLPVATPVQRAVGIAERHEFISIIWAVRVEFAFYFVVGAAIAVAARLRRSARFAAVSGGLAAGLLLHAFCFYLAPIAGAAEPILSYTPFFVAGVAWFQLENASTSGRRAALLAILAAAIALAVPRTIAYPLNHLRDGFGSIGISPTAAIGAVAMLLAGLVVAAALSRRRVTAAARRVDRAAGDLTYPIYVVHGLPLALAAEASLAARGAATLVALVAVLALAWLIDRAMKRAVDPLRDRLRGRPVPGAANEAVAR